VTGEPVTVCLSGTTISNPADTRDLHFGILWAAADACSCCANSLCMEMMFLKDHQTASQWLAADPANREIFDIDEAVDFGARFFKPLMQ
jgi:mercuric reductase